jgi:5'-nucleotidase
MNHTYQSGAPALVVAVASRALFNLDESHQIFEQYGEGRYAAYQIEHENVPLQPGVAFSLVRKLLALNERPGGQRVEVILLSRNSADTGLRIMNSIRHHGLDIRRAAFTRGRSPYQYAHAFGAKLFLSANSDDVRLALAAGMAAATILPSAVPAGSTGEVRIAFDGDAVIFSDESERVYASSGLAAFNDNEVRSREVPLPGGPFKPFLAALHALQSSHEGSDPPIRTALITARSAPAHERVIRTLRSWNIRIDEAIFLGGLDKGRFLEGFNADIFFDDQHRNCEAAANYVATGHVPYGVKNALPLAQQAAMPPTLSVVAASA